MNDSHRHFSPSRAQAEAIRRRAPTKLLFAGVIAIVAATAIAYLPALTGGFVVDDDGLVVKSHVMLASNGLYRIWFTNQMPDYWPLTYTIFWFEHQLWGDQPAGYHVVNVVLHISEALLIWLLLKRMRIPGAFLAALLFAVHPVNVASVAWVSEMKNLVAMLFFLMAILAYLEFEERSAAQRPRARLFYVLGVATFVLALLGKGSVAVLPVLLLVILWHQRGLSQRDFVLSVPFFALAAAFTLLNMHFQVHASGSDIRDATSIERMLGAANIVWFYLNKAVLPLNLMWAYPMWNIQVADWRWWLPLVGAVLLAGLLLRNRETWWGRPLIAASAWFVAALVPVMGLTDVGFMKFSLVADHYEHIAIIAVIALAAATWCAWCRQSHGFARVIWLALPLCAVAACGALTWQQCEHYTDADTFYRWILQTNPQAWFAEDNLGELLFDSGKTHEAIAHLDKALAINSKSYDAHINMGRALAKLGRVREAIAHLEAALSIAPKQYRALAEIAQLYQQVGRYKDAIAKAQDALEIAQEHGNEEEANNIEQWLAQGRAQRPDLFENLKKDEPLKKSK
jgi:protein O-mannosyl-transferase